MADLWLAARCAVRQVEAGKGEKRNMQGHVEFKET